MATDVIVLHVPPSTSTATPVEAVSSTLLANSYPSDMGRALALEDATPTSNSTDREQAFKRAGLR
jgi:hypothetical protein